VKNAVCPRETVCVVNTVTTRGTTKQTLKNAKDLVTISKKLKPNEKILMRVYSQGRKEYVALEAK
jgi:hypothetical protein